MRQFTWIPVVLVAALIALPGCKSGKEGGSAKPKPLNLTVNQINEKVLAAESRTPEAVRAVLGPPQYSETKPGNVERWQYWATPEGFVWVEFANGKMVQMDSVGP